MGRDKVSIEPRASASKRQATYLKRNNGLTKKAKDLSILCGAKLALLTFSPKGKASLVLGHDSELGEVLEMFSRVALHEREKRKREILQALSKTCRRQGHEIDMRMLTSNGDDKIQEYHEQLRALQEKIDEANKKLSAWKNPEAIDDKLQIIEMEKTLIKSLEIIQRQKQRLLEQQRAQIDAANLEGHVEEQHAQEHPASLEGHLEEQHTQNNPTALQTGSQSDDNGDAFELFQGLLQDSIPQSEEYLDKSKGVTEVNGAGPSFNPYEQIDYNSNWPGYNPSGGGLDFHSYESTSHNPLDFGDVGGMELNSPSYFNHNIASGLGWRGYFPDHP